MADILYKEFRTGSRAASPASTSLSSAIFRYVRAFAEPVVTQHRPLRVYVVKATADRRYDLVGAMACVCCAIIADFGGAICCGLVLVDTVQMEKNGEELCGPWFCQPAVISCVFPFSSWV